MAEPAITIARDEQSWIAANWKLAKVKWLWRRLLLEILGLWAVLTVLLVGLEVWYAGWDTLRAAHQAQSALVFALVAVAAVFLITLVMLPLRIRKGLRDHQKLSRETQFAFDAEGFRMESEVGTSKLKWSHLAWWSEDERMVMLVYSDTTMIVLAKADLGKENLEDLQAALRGAHVPSK